MKSGTYEVTKVHLDKDYKSVRALLKALGGKPQHCIVYFKNGDEPIFLAGSHKENGKVLLHGSGPDEGTRAVLYQKGLKLKVDVD